MKLLPNTDDYRKFTDSMSHEFSLCDKAFERFFWLSEKNILGAEDYDTLELLYSYYSDFLEHLYEFYVACIKRENGSTAKIEYTILDKLLTAEVEKLRRNTCIAIEKGYAPEWVNDISYYQKPVPNDFGKKFRLVRNNSSHVDHRRSGDKERPDLITFLTDYHDFAFTLYDSARNLWPNKFRKTHKVDHVKSFNLRTRKIK